MNNFVVYNVALELVRALRPIVAELRTHSSNIADQIERAGTSRAEPEHAVPKAVSV